MPEGPSLQILREEILDFKGKKISKASGYADLDYKLLTGKTIKDIRTHGKHLFIILPKSIIEIHLGLFGDYLINEKKKVNPKLHLEFGKGFLNFYVINVRLIDNLDAYDFSTDVMDKTWNPRAAGSKLKAKPNALICDAIVDQNIFAGVGNIIKNEVLWRAKIHPAEKIEHIPPAAMTILLKQVRKYTMEFLKYKKGGTLSKHWDAYKQEGCSRCGSEIEVIICGKQKRKNYTCLHCQKLHA